MYRLIDVRIGVLAYRYLVMIEKYVLEMKQDDEYWTLCVDNDDQVAWPEKDVPSKIRRLWEILVMRGSRIVPTLQGCDLDGPNLSFNHSYIQMHYMLNPIGMVFPDIGDTLPGIGNIEPWIDEALVLPWNRKCILWVKLLRRWKHMANKTRERTMARTRCIEEELIRTTWHPRRFQAWCLDTEEQKWLQDQFVDNKTTVE